MIHHTLKSHISQQLLAGSCFISALHCLVLFSALFSHMPWRQEGVSPLDIAEEINDTIITKKKNKPLLLHLPKKYCTVWVLECTSLRTQIALKFAELRFALCEHGLPHIHRGLGAPWIAVTLLSVRQES